MVVEIGLHATAAWLFAGAASKLEAEESEERTAVEAPENTTDVFEGLWYLLPEFGELSEISFVSITKQ